MTRQKHNDDNDVGLWKRLYQTNDKKKDFRKNRDRDNNGSSDEKDDDGDDGEELITTRRLILVGDFVD